MMNPHFNFKSPREAAGPEFHTLIHDLRQPLSVIETSAYCLRAMLDTQDPRVAEHLDRIEEQVFEAGLILLAALKPAADHARPEALESRARTNAESAALT